MRQGKVNYYYLTAIRVLTVNRWCRIQNGNNALQKAVLAKNTKIAKYILDLDTFDVNYQNLVRIKRKIPINCNYNYQTWKIVLQDGSTLLLICAENNDHEMMKYIIEKKGNSIDFNAKNKMGKSAWFIAIEKEYLDCVRILSENVNVFDIDEVRQKRIVKYWMSDESISTISKDGNNALMLAVKKCSRSIIRYLFRFDFDCSQKDKVVVQSKEVIIFIDRHNVGGIRCLPHRGAARWIGIPRVALRKTISSSFYG